MASCHIGVASDGSGEDLYMTTDPKMARQLDYQQRTARRTEHGSRDESRDYDGEKSYDQRAKRAFFRTAGWDSVDAPAPGESLVDDDDHDGCDGYFIEPIYVETTREGVMIFATQTFEVWCDARGLPTHIDEAYCCWYNQCCGTYDWVILSHLGIAS